MKISKGFTLLELMVTLAVISIAAVIAFPTFYEQLEKGKVKRAGRDLITNFQNARIGALKDGRPWAIQFDSSTNSYKVISDIGADNAWNTGDDEVVKTVTLSDYGSIAFGSGHSFRPGGSGPDDGIVFGAGDRVTFDFDGSSKSGTVYVYNTKKGHTLAVGSISTTGRIKTWVNFGDGWDPSS